MFTVYTSTHITINNLFACSFFSLLTVLIFFLPLPHGSVLIWFKHRGSLKYFLSQLCYICMHVYSIWHQTDPYFNFFKQNDWVANYLQALLIIAKFSVHFLIRKLTNLSQEVSNYVKCFTLALSRTLKTSVLLVGSMENGTLGMEARN